MTEELGQCPESTETTVCLSWDCPYKHDLVRTIPPDIEEAMIREIEQEALYAERLNTPEPIEWTPEHEIAFESYVDRMLKTQTKCPCGCGGMFVPPEKKETDNAEGN